MTVDPQPTAHLTLFFPILARVFHYLVQALQSQDADSALSLGRIVITLAETNTSHLLDCLLQEDAVPHSPASSSPSSSTPGVGRNAFNFISMILACSGAPGYYGVDELVSELPFGFWYSFQDEIVSANEDKRATLMVKVGLHNFAWSYSNLYIL